MDARASGVVLLVLLAMLVVAALLPVLAPGLIRVVDRDVLRTGKTER